MEGTKISYVHIVQANLNEYRAIIARGLDAIKGKNDDLMPFENVIDKIEDNSYEAMAILNHGEPIGFCVLSFARDLDNKFVLEGRLGYVKPALGFEFATEAFRAASVIADKVSAGRIRFESARKGWTKAAKANGYSVRKEGKLYKFVKERA